MKCPECSHNQLRGKDGMTCKKCGYEFFFDPKIAKHKNATYKLTDSKFLAIVNRASRGGTYKYTEEELYYVAALKSREKYGCFLFAFIVPAFMGCWISGMAGLKPFWLWALCIFISLLVICLLLAVAEHRNVISRKKWNKFVKQWQKATGPLPGLITEPSLHQPPASASEPDMFQYGASQLVICQHDIQVDWLVLNNFHTANAAVVISETGYPNYVSERVDDLVKNNPDLKIALIHNAGTTGEQMVNRFRDRWPLDSDQIIDMGISLEALKRFKINKNVLKQYGNNYPLHGIPYPVLSSLLSTSIVESSDFLITWEIVYGGDGDMDGAADGDGDGE